MKMSKDCFVFFATASHEHVLGGTLTSGGGLELVLSWAWALGLTVCPSLPQRPGSPSGLSVCLVSASLAPWHMPLCSF